jgi:hypothetical protein
VNAQFALGFVVKLGLTYIASDGDTLDTVEPWYQRAIDAAIIFAALALHFASVEAHADRRPSG